MMQEVNSNVLVLEFTYKLKVCVHQTMATKKQTDNPLSRLPLSKKIYFPILAIMIGLTVLGVGLVLQAAGDEKETLPPHSGDLAYLEIEAEEAQSIEYIVLNQAGMACDATIFIDSEIVVANEGQIEASIIEDEAAVGLCIRADYGYGNYLYKKYGDKDSFIHLDEEFAPGMDDWGLRVHTGNRQSAEYVILGRPGALCDVTAFMAESQVMVIEDDQLIPLSVALPLLCFRIGYNGHYVYEGYGRSGISFIEDRSKESSVNPDMVSSLIAVAPNSASIQYVIFNYAGKSCAANAFNIDQDFIHHPQAGEYDIFIEGFVVKNAKALCFRADYGDGGYVYEKYGGYEIVIRPRYRLELSSKKQDGQLLVRSNTEVAEWRFVQSNKTASIYGDDDTCSPNVFDQNDTASGQTNNLGPIYRQPTAYDEAPIENRSGNAGGLLVIELETEDYGRNYCIEAQDNKGSRAYLNSGIVTSDLIITIIQENNMLKAAVNQPEQVASWQVVKTSGVCSNFSFTDQANQKTKPIFELTRRDHNRYYCFKVTDKYGGYALRMSSLVQTVVVYLETLPVKQLDDVLLVEMLSGINRRLRLSIEQWRIAKTDQPVCAENVFGNTLPDGGSNTYKGNELIPLATADIGAYFCFAIDYRGGFVSYHLSEPINAFDIPSPSEGLQVNIKQYDNIILGRASKPVPWSSTFRVPEHNQCNAQLPSGFGLTTLSLYQYWALSADENGIYYCFKIQGTTPNTDLYFVSEVIEGVEGKQEEFEIQHPYQTPTSVDSGQDLANFLRPYLSDKGQEILDGIDEIILTSSTADFCWRPAGGCYIHNGEKISIVVSWSEDYNDRPHNEQKGLFGSALKTFIHEFMHATDYQDPQVQGLRDIAWRCVVNRTGGYIDVVEVLGSGIGNPAALQYMQCLDNSHSFFRQLRNVYDDLPEDQEINSEFTRYQSLTAIEARWGLLGGRYWKNSPSWYGELYAESVLIRDLPPELETHYDQYFKNRLDIIEALRK